jgi:phosphatidylglycerophosphatase A
VKKKIIKKIVELTSTVFYIGYTPLAPGTAASLATALVVWFLPEHSVMLAVGISLALLSLGVFVAGSMEQQLQIKDPSCIVIDEVLGMYIALIGAPKMFVWYTIAFVLFRIFDIGKPFPINFLEKRIPGGIGIMFDDLVAGLISLGLSIGLHRVVLS